MECRGGNLPPATLGIQPVGLNGTTRYMEQCSGIDQRHPAPARGWLRWMLRIQTYHGSGPTGRLAADCRRYSGDTVFRVIPFTPTGYTSNVAGGRLPPLRQRTTFFILTKQVVIAT